MVDQKLPDAVEKQVLQLKQWLDQQPQTPNNIEEKLCLRFLHSCYYDMEKAKTTAELFFNIRTSAPELLTNRDPLSAPLQKALKIVNLAQYQISGNRNLWIWQLNDPGLENYDYLMDAKVFFMTTDVWLLDSDFLEEDDVVIMDVKDISLKFLTKFNVSIAKKMSKYQEDAMPIRLKQVHVINSPPIIDKIFALLKPFLNKEMIKMFHFHSPTSTTLFDFVNKEDLPEEYGGNRGKLSEHTAKAIASLVEKREILLNDNFWRSENKNGKSNKSETFRSLAID